eukprot:COSAG01_NODE_1563_length_9897_cov_10.242703_13_plen_93_part_00
MVQPTSRQLLRGTLADTNVAAATDAANANADALAAAESGAPISCALCTRRRVDGAGLEQPGAVVSRCGFGCLLLILAAQLARMGLSRGAGAS